MAAGAWLLSTISAAQWLGFFGDVAFAYREFRDFITFADAGLGASVRGRIFDRAVQLRPDSPLYVHGPELVVGEEDADPGRVKVRWTFSFNDLR